MKKLLVGLMALSMLSVSPVHAQSATYASTMSTCTAVIAEQYASTDNPRPRWLECVGAVEKYLTAIGAPSAAADPAIGELVAALVELYEDDADCKIKDTELPLAIATAAAAVYDTQVKAEYVLIGEQVSTCDLAGTSSIDDSEASAG